MKVLKSIKWRLQLWYGLILVAVLAGFGFTAYQLERGRMLGRIDDELLRRVGVLANAMRPPPRGPGANEFPPRGPGSREQPFDRPPRGQFPDNGMPGQGPPPPMEFHLPSQAAGLFDTNDPNHFYFAIFSDGRELAHSTNAPNPTIFAHAENMMRPAIIALARTWRNRWPSRHAPESVEISFRLPARIGHNYAFR